MNQKSENSLPGPYDIGNEYSFDKQRGWTTTVRKSGLLSELQGLFDGLVASGCTSLQCVRDGESPLYNLTASFGGYPEGGGGGVENDPVNSYELMDNQLLQPTLISQRLQANITAQLTGGATLQSALARIRDSYNKVQRGEISGEDLIISEWSDIATDYGIAAATCFDDMIKGVQTFFNYHYVFRRTLTVVDDTDIEASFVGIKKVWTVEQIVAAEAVPNDIFFSLTTIGGQWLKTPPNVMATSNGRTQITYEYWQADTWSDNYYETYAG